MSLFWSIFFFLHCRSQNSHLDNKPLEVLFEKQLGYVKHDRKPQSHAAFLHWNWKGCWFNQCILFYNLTMCCFLYSFKLKMNLISFSCQRQVLICVPFELYHGMEWKYLKTELVKCRLYFPSLPCHHFFKFHLLRCLNIFHIDTLDVKGFFFPLGAPRILKNVKISKATVISWNVPLALDNPSCLLLFQQKKPVRQQYLIQHGWLPSVTKACLTVTPTQCLG